MNEEKRVGDVVRWMVNKEFCCEALTLKAATPQSVEVGSPLRDNTGYILVANGQEANATAIALENVEVTGSEKVLCLVRGPAIVNPSQMHFETDVAWSEVAAYFLALKILGIAQPTYSTQTT